MPTELSITDTLSFQDAANQLRGNYNVVYWLNLYLGKDFHEKLFAQFTDESDMKLPELLVIAQKNLAQLTPDAQLNFELLRWTNNSQDSSLDRIIRQNKLSINQWRYLLDPSTTNLRNIFSDKSEFEDFYNNLSTENRATLRYTLKMLALESPEDLTLFLSLFDTESAGEASEIIAAAHYKDFRLATEECRTWEFIDHLNELSTTNRRHFLFATYGGRLAREKFLTFFAKSYLNCDGFIFEDFHQALIRFCSESKMSAQQLKDLIGCFQNNLADDWRFVLVKAYYTLHYKPQPNLDKHLASPSKGFMGALGWTAINHEAKMLIIRAFYQGDALNFLNQYIYPLAFIQTEISALYAYISQDPEYSTWKDFCRQVDSLKAATQSPQYPEHIRMQAVSVLNEVVRLQKKSPEQTEYLNEVLDKTTQLVANPTDASQQSAYQSIIESTYQIYTSTQVLKGAMLALLGVAMMTLAPCISGALVIGSFSLSCTYMAASAGYLTFFLGALKATDPVQKHPLSAATKGLFKAAVRPPAQPTTPTYPAVTPTAPPLLATQ